MSAPADRSRSPQPFEGRPVAIVHDWLTGMRGGEWVLDALCELLPHAEIHTLVHVPGKLNPRIEAMTIHTSKIDRLPGAHRKHQPYLPFFPRAVEAFDLSRFDFVISTSHCIAKGARARPGARHVCYCHTPMRYVWTFYDQYFRNERTGFLTRTLMPPIASYLRKWDKRTAHRVDRYLANSRHVAARIRSIYERESEVVHPPVDTIRFRWDAPRDDFLLMVTALVPYKRADLAVRVCTERGLPLVIAGRGPEEEHLRALAGPTVEFRGWVSDDEIADLYARARALVFPGEEDFGIVPLEAMASGCPVIAYARGGALETVVDGRDAPTGLFFRDQTPESLAGALDRLETAVFDPATLRAHAERFDRTVFLARMNEILREEEGR